MGLGLLPKELQCLVLEFLASELLNVRLVCKEWLLITQNSLELQVEERGTFMGLRAGSYKDITVEHLEQLLVLFPQPRAIYFTSALPTHDRPFEPLAKIATLQRLNLQMCASHRHRDHLDNLSLLSNLHELRYGARSIDCQDPLRLPVGRGLNQLHRLVLEVRGRLELSLVADLSVDHLPHLEELFVLSGVALSDESLLQLDRFKKLRTLWFGEKYKGISKIEDNHFETIGRCNKLTQLVLLNVSSISGEGLRNLTALTSLQVLRLRNGPKLSDLRAIAHLQQMRQMILEDLPALEESGLQGLASLRQLEFLRMKHVGSAQFLPAYLRQLPAQRLRSLEIGGSAESPTSAAFFPFLKPFSSLATLRLVGVKATLLQLRQLPAHIRELYGVEICG